MTDFASRNAERAGVGRAIEFKTADALQRPRRPPRHDDAEPALRRAHRRPRARRGAAPVRGKASKAAARRRPSSPRWPAHWKRHYPGWTAWLLSPEMKLPQAMRLKESRRVPMWNGPIECRLFRFDLVAGSAR
jgi:putative N6-adenine-specific DNA methylase